MSDGTGEPATGTPVRAGELLAQAAALGTSTLHEAAGKIGALPPVIHCLTPGLVLAGRAVTVMGPPGDNLWLHRALYAAAAGEVLVVEPGHHPEAGYWGEVLSHAARARGLAGLVIDGCVRDSDRLTPIGLPVFGRGFCMRGTSKHANGTGSINEPLALGEVIVQPGDVVIGDGDGVLVLPPGRLGDVIEAAVRRQDQEAEIIRALRAGATTLDLYGLPAAPSR
jgi:4-hydroxy-4-methyl-2-oxoglutarate aldolase